MVATGEASTLVMLSGLEVVSSGAAGRADYTRGVACEPGVVPLRQGWFR